MMSRLFKPLDLLLAAVLLLGAAGLWLLASHGTQGATAVIIIDGSEYERIELDRVENSYELVLPCSPEAVLLVEKGAVSFCRADCRDKICVSAGKLTKRGDIAACLPARVVVKIENGAKSEIDVLVY